MKFNTAIASLMSLINLITDHGTLTIDELKIFLLLLNPFAPHITEEIWERHGGTSFLAISDWPEYDEAKTVDTHIEIAIQVNGKLKGRLTISADLQQAAVLEAVKECTAVKEAISDRQIVKEIYVPGKLVNIVVR